MDGWSAVQVEQLVEKEVERQVKQLRHQERPWRGHFQLERPIFSSKKM